MARLQYQRAVKSGSYQAQQVDERNIARLREEAARQIDGMRAAANAEIESRREVARSMKEDAAYTARAEERNLLIQTQNSQRELQGLQAQAQRDQNQAVINQKATQSIFENISTLSKTAGEYADKLVKQREYDEYVNSFGKTVDGKTSILMSYQDADMRVKSVEYEQSLKEAEAKGQDPKVISELRLKNPALLHDKTLGEIGTFFDKEWQFVVQAEVQKIRDTVGGRQLDENETARAIGAAWDWAYSRLHANKLNSKYVQQHTQNALAYDRSLLKEARDRTTRNNNEQTVETGITNIAQAAPENRAKVFGTVWPIISGLLGPTKAWDLVTQKVFTVQDPKTGKFDWTEEQIAQLPIHSDPSVPGGGSTTFGQKYSKNGVPIGRFAEILATRINLDKQYRKQQIDAADLTNAELEDTLVRSVMENPTVERLEEAKQMYTAASLKESSKLAVIEKHLTFEAKEKQNIIKGVTKLRDFELTPEIVAAAVAADPTKGRDIKARFDAYNAKWKSDSYKDSLKTLETLISGTTTFGTTKAASAGALPMISYLKSQLRARTAIYEATLGFEAAHQKAANELTNEYSNGYRNKDSRYYRKVSRNGTVSYPKLPVGNIPAADKTRREIDELKAAVKKNGVEAVMDTPLSVTSAERLNYIKQNFYKDSFKPTPKELAFIGMTKGVPLHEAYNRFFRANNDSFRLKSPLQLNGKELTLTPEDRKILSDPTKGTQAKLNVINRILNPGMYQNPSSMRPGSPFLIYTSGNIGPTSTGPHLDVKRKDRTKFATTALDNYIEVDDPELGRVPLSRVPITGSFAEHTARGSHGIDYGLYKGTKIYAKNGARVISNTPTEHGDMLLIQLPDGTQYTFLHGKAVK